MTMNMKTKLIITLLPAALCLAACDVNRNSPDPVPDPVPEWISIETYAGGELGTTFNVSASAFEDPTPAVENAGLEQEFKHGELIFEHNFGPTSEPFDGLGPEDIVPYVPSGLRPWEKDHFLPL